MWMMRSRRYHQMTSFPFSWALAVIFRIWLTFGSVWAYPYFKRERKKWQKTTRFGLFVFWFSLLRSNEFSWLIGLHGEVGAHIESSMHANRVCLCDYYSFHKNITVNSTQSPHLNNLLLLPPKDVCACVVASRNNYCELFNARSLPFIIPAMFVVVVLRFAAGFWLKAIHFIKHFEILENCPNRYKLLVPRQQHLKYIYITNIWLVFVIQIGVCSALVLYIQHLCKL